MAQPLSKKKQDGTLYRRPDAIEAAIDEAAREDLDTLKHRAGISRRSAAGFLPLECLVYFIRDAARRGDERAMSALMPQLLNRCEAILKAKIPADYVHDADTVREEILGEFAVLFAEDGLPGTTNALDYFECRFNAAFLTFRQPLIQRERARSEALIYAPPQSESLEDFSDEDFFAQISETFRYPASQTDDVLRNRLMKAIDELPPDQRKAMILYYVYGFPEESDDPSVTTVASLCEVTGRTVRNRLNRAVATLSKLFNREGEIHQ